MLPPGPAPATIENIDYNGQHFRLQSLVVSKSERQARELLMRCFRSIAPLFLSQFEPFPPNYSEFWEILSILGHFGTSAPCSIVNMLSTFFYCWHSGEGVAAQIPLTIDNILNVDGPSNCCNNIFNISAGP